MGGHRKPVKCALCKGKGYIEIGQNGNVKKRTCSRCDGSGEIK